MFERLGGGREVVVFEQDPGNIQLCQLPGCAAELVDPGPLQRAVETGQIHDGEFAQIFDALLHLLALATPGKELEIGDVFAQRRPRLCASLKDLRQSESRPGSDWVLPRSQRPVKLYGLFKVAGQGVEFA